MTDGQLRFLPWVRRGLAAGIPQAAPTNPTGRAGLHVALDVRLDNRATPETVAADVELYGPGDVVSIDTRQVIRTDPADGTASAEPNYLAAVELDNPELPWLFTPDPMPSGAGAAKLRPWICLVVVRADRGRIVPDPRRPVPSLVLADATGELPDLAESWAWAHVQLAGTSAPLHDALDGPPESTLSRLVCPRRLSPLTSYIGCVVPTFLAGVQAGLGQTVTATTQPAWGPAPTGRVELPVYAHWTFATGVEGDFESLVRKLSARAADARVGLRPVDLSAPGPDLPAPLPGTPAAIVDVPGPLRSPAPAPAEWPPTARDDFRAALTTQLAAAQGQASTVVRPPLYGSDHAGVGDLAAAANRRWLPQLNLDPRHRVAAALGTRVVQEQQEQLMASAWDQVGELLRANQLRRQAQLTRAIAASVRERRLGRLDGEALLRVTEPAHARVVAPAAAPGGGNLSLAGSVETSVLPETAVEASFRRALRPRGPLGRRAGEPAALVERLAVGTVQVPLAPRVPGSVELDAVGTQKLQHVTAGVPGALGWSLVVQFRDILTRELPLAPSAAATGRRAPSEQGSEDVAGADDGSTPRAMMLPIDDLPPDTGETDAVRRERLRGINRRFRAAANELQAWLTPPPAAAALVAPPSMPLDTVAGQMLGTGGRLDPEITVPAAVVAVVTTPPATQVQGPDPLAPLGVAPRFPQPMYETLRAIAPDAVLPGIEHLPPNTVSILRTNAAFVEAFMVGLNHEMGRELAWRGLPADPRATYFDQFWDVRGRDPGAPEPGPDIPPISTWPDRDLGTNATRVGPHEMLVVVVRGEVVRRHPNLTVYAVEAADRHHLTSHELLPSFRGRLEDDLLFAGFALTPTAAQGDATHPGWFVVLQEQALASRFGFDAVPDPDDAGGRPRFGGTPASWNDLTWGGLVTNEADYDALRYVTLAGPKLNPGIKDKTIGGATWALDAAHMADVTLQRPMRVAVHASALLPLDTGTEEHA